MHDAVNRAMHMTGVEGKWRKTLRARVGDHLEKSAWCQFGISSRGVGDKGTSGAGEDGGRGEIRLL
jgi:hypothetical protein